MNSSVETQTQRPQQVYRFWPLLLAVAYLALIPALARLEDVVGVRYLLGGSAAACVLYWYAQLRRPSSIRLPGPLKSGIVALQKVPPALLGLPLPISISWVAGMMVRTAPTDADYYLAFAMWLGALILLIAISLVPLAGRNPLGIARLPRVWWPELGAVVFVTVGAFVIRFIDLADAPGPFGHDEGLFSNLGLQVANGVRKDFLFPGAGSYLSDAYELTVGLPFKLFGPSVLMARLPHAIAGTATVVLLYFMLREMFDRRVALVGAAVLAVYHFHVHFSRIAFPNVYDTLFAVLVLLFAFRAIRTQQLVDFAVTGLAAGVQFYFFSGARLLPVVLAILMAYMALRTRGRFVRQNFWGLGVLLGAFVVAALPAALYWDGNPGTFESRWQSENIFDSGWLDQEVARTGHSELHVLWDQFQQSLGILVAYADVSRFYNAEIPLLTGISSIFFVIGGVYALFHIYQPRFLALFALLLLAVVFSGTLLAGDPQVQRYLSTVPVTVTFVALGVVVAADAMASVLPRFRSYAPVLIGPLVLLIAFVDLDFYFGTYLPLHSSDDPRNLHAQAAASLEEFDDSYTVYFLAVPGLQAREHALMFRNRDKILVDVLADGEIRDTFVETVPLSGEAAAAARRSKPNALFLVPTGIGGRSGRSAELQTIVSTCPDGSRTEVTASPPSDFTYVLYDVEDAQTCVDRLEATGLLKQENVGAMRRA